MKARRLLTLLALAPLAVQAQAASVRCHIVYGGEHFTVDAAPTDDPYRATGTKIGRYFEFKPVYVDRVATGKAVKVWSRRPRTRPRSPASRKDAVSPASMPSTNPPRAANCSTGASTCPEAGRARDQAPSPTGQLTPVPPSPQ